MDFILVILTAMVVLATLMPLSTHSHWIIRGMDFPRMQLAILSAALCLAGVLFLDSDKHITQVLVLASAACLIWHLWWIFPYTFLSSREVKSADISDPDRQLSIITSNVLMTNHNSDALIKLVDSYQPDILVTLESDQWWEDRLDQLEAFMPNSVKCPLDNLYGMHVYSRLPVSEEEISYLVEDDVPSIHLSLQLRSGEKVRMHFLHPAPPSPTENTESAERDAELIVVAKSIAKTDQPVVVTGDLNDVAWSRTTRLFRKISGLLDPRIGRGIFSTFHADYFFMRWPLDHLFHSAHFTLKSIKRLPPIGSDHFALFTALVFTSVPVHNQEGLAVNQADRKKADDLASDKDVDRNDVPQPD